MNHKLRSTAAGLATVALFAAFTLTTSTPVTPDTGITRTSAHGGSSDARAATVSGRARYAMPYYSFARLLSRRES